MMDAEPKSPSFTKPGSDSRMFPAFTSLPKAKHRGKTCISGRLLGRGFGQEDYNPEQGGVVYRALPPSQPSPVLLVPMDHVVGVQISQALKGPVGHSCNLHLLKGLLVHWGVKGVHGGAGTTSPLPVPYSFSALLPSPTCWPKNHLPSRRSEAEPRQYSITSYGRVKGQRSADLATPGLARSGRDPKQRASLPSHYSSKAPRVITGRKDN